jgi:hypothetical protein
MAKTEIPNNTRRLQSLSTREVTQLTTWKATQLGRNFRSDGITRQDPHPTAFRISSGWQRVEFRAN